MKHIFSLLALFPAVAMARADIDTSDFDGPIKIWALLAGAGVFGAIACRSHPDLVEEHSGTVNALLQWVLRVALVLVGMSIAGGFLGFYFDLGVGSAALGIWGTLKAAQGVYISGLAKKSKGRN